MNMMHQSQAEVEIRTPGDTLCDVDAKASADMLTVEKVFETLTDLKGISLF